MRPGVDFEQLLDTHFGVNLCRLQLGVAEQLLDEADMQLELWFSVFGETTWPLSSNSAALIKTPRLFAAGVTFKAYSLASIPAGKRTLKHSIPMDWRREASLSDALSPVLSRS
jgi:hypothetical protein